MQLAVSAYLWHFSVAQTSMICLFARRTVVYVDTVDRVLLAVDRALAGTQTFPCATVATSSRGIKASAVLSAARRIGILHSPRCCCVHSASGE